VRERLVSLTDELATSREVVQITRNGKPVLALLSWAQFDAVMETLEVMGQVETMAALRASIADLHAGRTISLDALEAELALPEGSR
jgi:PHD/YefM family antitoxin component YafN of YafNO toxin-antitoxin module